MVESMPYEEKHVVIDDDRLSRSSIVYNDNKKSCAKFERMNKKFNLSNIRGSDETAKPYFVTSASDSWTAAHAFIG